MLRLTTICALFLPACLGHRYRIEKPELERMVRAAPSERPRHVRVVQESAGVHEPGDSGARFVSRSEAAMILLTLPIVVPVRLASEAARFDGWIDLPADQVIHLYTENSRARLAWRSRTAETLTLDDARWADGAVVAYRAWGLVRRDYNKVSAPLQRQGFGLTLEARGGGTLGDGRGSSRAFGLRTSFSYHFHPLVGIAAVLDWSRLPGEQAGVRDARTGLELQVFAPPLARTHIGAYALAGVARSRRRLGASEILARGAFVDLGVLLQLELAPRFAAQARAGVWIFGGEPYPSFALGFTIY